jgi:hypothetical protein
MHSCASPVPAEGINIRRVNIKMNDYSVKIIVCVCFISQRTRIFIILIAERRSLRPLLNSLKTSK